MVVEGSGAMSVAAALGERRDGPVVCILTGAVSAPTAWRKNHCPIRIG